MFELSYLTTTKQNAFLEAIPLPAVLIGADQRIIHANKAFSEIFAADYAGRHFVSAIRQPAVIEAVEQVLTGAATATATYAGREGSRDTVYDVFVRPIETDVLVTLIDRSEAEAVGRMRSDFIANVSHELRTPLTALMGFIETLGGAARNDAKARDRFLGIMAQEAGRMTRLVDELLTLSRLEGVARRRPTEKISLTSVLRSATDALTPIAQKAQVSLHLFCPTEPVMVVGDAAQLQQVFTNLIENALKYGDKGGRVDISLSDGLAHDQTPADAVVVQVRDYGDGIAAHHIPRLTERFYRVDSHRSRALGGTGLGLAIVKHIINRHRGRLKIESTLGQGTTISVLLPE